MEPRTTFDVKGRIIGGGQPFVVAEMAWSHDGSRALAIAIANAAGEAGADSVNIHITDMPSYMVRHYGSGPGRVSAGKESDSVWNYLDGINLDTHDWKAVAEVVRDHGMALAVMPNDHRSLDVAEELEPDLYTLSPACFEEEDFIRRVAATGRPLLIRVGGATLGEIEAVVRLLLDEDNGRFVLLHGLQNYPTTPEDTDLLRLATLHQTFGCLVGLADHLDAEDTLAMALPLMSLPLGACVVEKHVTHDRSARGEDHESALDPAELTELVSLLRRAAAAVGRPSFRPLTDAEMRYRLVARKRLVAASAIQAGQIITEADLTTKRADVGASPTMKDAIIGRVARQDIPADGGVELDLTT